MRGKTQKCATKEVPSQNLTGLTLDALRHQSSRRGIPVTNFLDLYTYRWLISIVGSFGCSVPTIRVVHTSNRLDLVLP